MSQKSITAVVDEWTKAIARLAQHAPPDAVTQLHQATGDLIEAFGSAATNLAAHEVVAVLVKLTALQVGQDADHQLLEALDARTDRRKTVREHE